MAVPSAVARRREREEADLRTQGVDPANPAPPEVQLEVQSPAPAPSQPTADPVVHADPAPVAVDVEAAQARIRELEAELSTTNGRTASSSRELQEARRNLEIVTQNREFLENRLAELAQENEALKKTKTVESIGVDVASLDDNVISEAMKERFDNDTMDFVKRVTRQIVAPLIKPLVDRIAQLEGAAVRVSEIDKELPALRRSAGVAELSEARVRETEFLRKEILPAFPDFETVAKTPEWRAYLQQQVPGRNVKIADMLQAHRQSSNAVALRGLIGAYYDQRKAKPTLDSLSVPGKTGAEAPLRQPVPKIKNSEYIANLKAFTSKRMSKEQWNEFRTRFEAAMAAGNVEADVEIR